MFFCHACVNSSHNLQHMYNNNNVDKYRFIDVIILNAVH